MRAKIENSLSVEVTGVDLTSASKLEFYVRQGCVFWLYKPTVIDENHLLVKIPYEDAMQMKPVGALLQLALTDGDGNKQATDIVPMPVRELLKEAGYA